MKRPPKPPKPAPFTEEQIRARAQALWQARVTSGKSGTEAGDWEAAKESLLVEHSLPKGLRSLWSPAQPTEAQKSALELHKLQLERLKVWVAGLGLAATIFAGVGLVVNYQQGQERLITDRFSKAVEQLGSQDIDVRLGGIYSLERIAKDSPKDHWTVMEVLTAYVRNKSPLPKDWFKTPPEKRKPLEPVATDVQSALTVIGRREAKQDPAGKYLNLMHSNLSGSNLYEANLTDAYLWFAGLSRASLGHADLRGAHIWFADLTDTYGITPNQIKQAENWDKAHYNLAFRQQLGLPPEEPSKPSPLPATPNPKTITPTNPKAQPLTR